MRHHGSVAGGGSRRSIQRWRRGVDKVESGVEVEVAKGRDDHEARKKMQSWVGPSSSPFGC
jgi:hypothetical protein